jgi:hypothetical protein
MRWTHEVSAERMSACAEGTTCEAYEHLAVAIADPADL